jgi:hypothetical protein
MQGVLNDLRQSVRMLQRNLGFTVTAIAALALGIGANTAIFSVVNAVLLRPLPYPNPDGILIFKTASPQGSIVNAASPAKFNIWREQTGAFQDVSAYRFSNINMTGVEHPEQIRSAFVSASYFRLFGQRVTRGRAFTTDEDRPEGGDVVVLSDTFWKRVFGGDPSVLGRTILLDGRLHQVIGIMAPAVQSQTPVSFDGAHRGEPIDVWMPVQIDPDSPDQNGYLNVAGRLAPGPQSLPLLHNFSSRCKNFAAAFRPQMFPRGPSSPSSRYAKRSLVVHGPHC